MVTTVATKIKQKILGLLIRSAHEKAGLNLAETAALLGLTPAALEAYEIGRAEPDLPTLEALARISNVPVSYFWSDNPLPALDREYATQKAIILRRKIIGVLLNQARAKANQSQKNAAKYLGCSVEQITAYETGQTEIPFSRLNALTSFLDIDLNYFLNGNGAEETQPAAQPLAPPPTAPAPPPPAIAGPAAATSISELQHLPPEVSDFMQDPANILYVKLAMRLQSLSTETLRTLAEGILDITY